MTEALKNTRILVEPDASAELLPFARNKLRQMHEQMRYMGVPNLTKTFESEQGAVTVTASELPGVDDRIQIHSLTIEHFYPVGERGGSIDIHAAFFGVRNNKAWEPPDLHDPGFSQSQFELEAKIRSTRRGLVMRNFPVALGIVNFAGEFGTGAFANDLGYEDTTVAVDDEARFLTDPDSLADRSAESSKWAGFVKKWEQYEGDFLHDLTAGGFTTVTFETNTGPPDWSMLLVEQRISNFADTNFNQETFQLRTETRYRSAPGTATSGMTPGQTTLEFSRVPESKFQLFRRLRAGWVLLEEGTATATPVFNIAGTYDTALGVGGTNTATFSAPIYVESMGARRIAGYGLYRVIYTDRVGPDVVTTTATHIKNVLAGRQTYVISTFTAPRSGRTFQLLNNGRVQIVAEEGGVVTETIAQLSPAFDRFPVAEEHGVPVLSQPDYLQANSFGGTATSGTNAGFHALPRRWSYDGTATASFSVSGTSTSTSTQTYGNFELAFDALDIPYKRFVDLQAANHAPLAGITGNNFNAGILYRPRDEAFMLVDYTGSPTIIARDKLPESMLDEFFIGTTSTGTIVIGTATLTVTTTRALGTGAIILI